MKIGKRLLSLVAAAAMTVSLCGISAFAADPAPAKTVDFKVGVPGDTNDANYDKYVINQKGIKVDTNIKTVGGTETAYVTVKVPDVSAMVNLPGDPSKDPAPYYALVLSANGIASDKIIANGYGIEDADISEVANWGGETGKDVVIWLRASDRTRTFTLSLKDADGQGKTVAVEVTVVDESKSLEVTNAAAGKADASTIIPAEKADYEQNMSAIKKVEVSGDVINVVADIRAMKEYNTPGGVKTWYSLAVTFASKPAGLASLPGSSYGIMSEDITDAAIFGDGAHVVLWLNAKDPTRTISFLDESTGALKEYTVKVTQSAIEEAKPVVPEASDEVKNDAAKKAVADEIAASVAKVAAPENMNAAVKESVRNALDAGAKLTVSFKVEDVVIGTNNKPASIKFDIKPIILKADASTVGLTNDDLTGSAIKIAIPLPKAFAEQFAKVDVKHTLENGNVEKFSSVEVMGRDTDAPYIVIDVTSFSTFEISEAVTTPVAPETPKEPAKSGDTMAIALIASVMLLGAAGTVFCMKKRGNR